MWQVHWFVLLHSLDILLPKMITFSLATVQISPACPPIWLLVITSCLKYLYRLHLSTDGILMFTSCLIINITYICWPMDYLCLPVVLSTNITCTCTPMESSFLPLVLSTSKVHLPTLRQSSSEIRRSALMPAAQIWITAWTLHSFQNLKKGEVS